MKERFVWIFWLVFPSNCLPRGFLVSAEMLGMMASVYAANNEGQA
jgi:hypothetical protein